MSPDHRSASHRQFLRQLYASAVAATHPDRCLPPALPDLPGNGRVIILGAGKAAGACVAAAERHYLDTRGYDPARLSGLAVTRHGHGVQTRHIPVIEAGHPVPDAAGIAATDATLKLAAGAGPEDLVLVLLSGGGSANWVAPADGLTLDDKQAVTRALLRSGAPIDAMNTVRKHLSRIKGGRLATAASPARVLTLAISDVPRDDPSSIASGPTVADPTTLADARAIFERYHVTVPDVISRALANPANESPKPGDPRLERAEFRIVARPVEALKAVSGDLAAAGYRVIDAGSDLEGEAREVARAHAAQALELAAQGRRVALVSGGELTVTIKGDGVGGPNQEYILALAIALKGTPGIYALAGDTDGADGGSGGAHDPAGAYCDPGTLSRARDFRLDPAQFLANNDSGTFFRRLGDLLVTGPTLTNVNDVRVVLIDPASGGMTF